MAFPDANALSSKSWVNCQAHKQKGQNKGNWKAKLKQNKSQERGSGLFDEEDEEVGGEGDQRNGTPATWRWFSGGDNNIVRDHKLICY